MPSPPLAVAGAIAPPSTEATLQASQGAAPGTSPPVIESCRKAFRDRRAKDVLQTCALAFTQDPRSADVAVMLAKTEFDRGRARQALDWAKKAVAIDENHADAYVYMGGAEQAAGHSAAAKSAYKRYLQLAPRGRFAADLRAVLLSL
jgi:tetratricopeptide (TPR) repeat protein